MHTLLNPLLIMLLFIVVRAGNLAITYALGRDTLRAILYGLLALLALIVIILSVF